MEKKKKDYIEGFKAGFRKTSSNLRDMLAKIEYNDDLNGYDLENTENTENKSIYSESDSDHNEEINENLSLIELQKIAKELQINIFDSTNQVRKIKNKKQLCTEILKKKKS